MSDLSLIPLQDGFETQLSQDWDGNTGTIYVLATPSYTPTTTNTYIVVNPGKTNMQIAEITDYDSTAKTLTVSSISFEKGLGISSTAQDHSTGSKVIISDNYQFWEDIQTAINSKLDKNGGNTAVYASTAARDSALGGNGAATLPYSDIYVTATGLFYNYNLNLGQWQVVSTGTAPANATTTTSGVLRTDVAPSGVPVAFTTDNTRYPATAGAGGTPSASNLFETQYDTSNASTRTATTISFVSGTKTIADSGNGLVTAGFKQGTQITITGSASNNGTFTIVSVAAGAIVVAESLVNESAGASVTITSVTANKLVRYNSDGDIGGTPSDAFFGDGSDGDVTISVDTNLGRDMYYNNLTINNGITLSPKGFRIFVKGTLACTGTGKIASNGGAGGAGAVGGAATPAGGTAGAIDYANGTLPTPKAGVVGSVGQQAAANILSGTNGLAVTLNETNSVAVAGGNSGRGSHSAPTGTGGAAGSPGTQPVMRPHNFISAYNLYDVIGVTFTKHDIAPTGGSGAGGGGNGTTVYGGGGGGSGSTGGFIAIFAKTISSLNVEAIGGAGGAGGAATNNNGGGGGGAGGNGGYILLFYKTKVSVTSNVSGGVGGVGGAIGTGTSGAGTAGTSGNPGVVNEISI